MNKSVRKSGLAHCLHHDIHWEFCSDFDERVTFIKEHKPKEEQPLRLKLLRLIPDDILPKKDSAQWEAYVKAGEAYDKVREACDKAWEAYDKTREAYDKAGEAYDKAREAYDKAWEAYVKAGEAYVKAREAYVKIAKDDLDKLHDKLFPDCPWNGETILGKRGSL